VGATPTTVTPNGDGQSDSTTIAYTLGEQATVTATLLDAHGMTTATLFSGVMPAGPQSFDWNPAEAPDGRYRIEISVHADDGQQASAGVPVLVDRTLSGFLVSPATFSPNGDGRNDTVSLTFGLAALAEARIEIFQIAALVATPFPRQALGPGDVVAGWDGTNGGARLADGGYEAVLTVSTPVGEVSLRVPLTIDTTPPQLRIVDATRWRFWISEPATVTLVVNGQTITTVVQQRGNFSLPHTVRAMSISASAIDAAGNLSAPLTWP
jgi:hypothetical protein